MSDIGWIELLVIVAIVAIAILAPKNLPRLFRWVSRSIRRPKQGAEEGKGKASAAGTEDAASDKDE